MGVSKKWILIFLAAGVLIAASYLTLTNINDFKRTGELNLPGLHEPVRVVRDEKGMAYLYAKNMDDLFLAQGFITAQDRLFNMELLRLIVTGRLTEVFGDEGEAGKKAKESDTKMRTIGFARNAVKHAALLDAEERNRFQKYIDGINLYLTTQQNELPLELKLAGIKPTKWEIADSLAILYFMGWGSSANLKTEIIAQLLVEKVGAQKARDLFPLNINPDDPAGQPLPYQITRNMPSGVPLAALNGLLPLIKDNQLAVGSNNWVTSASLSASGKPILANDPHLEVSILPGPFYPLGLICPEFRAVGVIVPGLPGMVIGRTDTIAFGVTNGYGDLQDLYLETLYSENPDQYIEDNRSFPLRIVEEVLKIKDSSSATGFREETVKVRLTPRGPLVSGLFGDLKSEKVFSLRWSPFETMGPKVGFLDLLTVKDVFQAREVLRNVNAIMLNFVLADQTGNIAWQTTGRIPIRSQGDGTIPYEVKKTGDNWQGWIPWDEMPHSTNPKKGWVGTTNHTIVDGDYPYYFSSYFAPSWRYNRLKQLLSSPGPKTATDHWSYQRDTKNLMAERVTPVLVAALASNQQTSKLAQILRTWDYHDDPEKNAPTVYQALMMELMRQTFEDELGRELVLALTENWYFWQERMVSVLEKGQDSWFDDTRTPNKTESLQEIIIRAGLATQNELSDRFGTNPDQWSWGKVHQLELVSALRRTGIGKQLIGGGSYPMPGSGETLQRAYYLAEEPYNVIVSAVLRMVVDLGDPDKIMAVLPGGVSARMLDPHRTDQVKHFVDGTKLYWWFSDQVIKEHTATELKLVPLAGINQTGE